jgi:hypothetical protein
MRQSASKVAEAENQRIVLKPATARRIMVRAFELGQMSTGPSFHRYSADCTFTTVDAEMLIRHGRIVDEAYDKEFDSLVYYVAGRVDGRIWKLTVAIDCEEDYWDSPWITLMSAQQTSSPKRRGKKDDEEDDEKMPKVQVGDAREKGELPL